MSLIPWYARWLVVLALVAAVAGFAAFKMHSYDEVKYQALLVQYNQFEGGVAAIGHASQLALAKRIKDDNAAKEKADENNQTRIATLDRTVARLRRDAAARNSRGGSTGAAPTGSRCPAGQTCFDTAQYQRAFGTFDSGARRLADECSQVEIDLGTVRDWYNGLKE
ncbi:MAG: hypothetical protein ACYDBH_00420 [Acidobacteriaceae bacterium]